MLAVIPCRKGSKGIPNKNFRDFCGKPLWQWTANAAIGSGIFDHIVCSSDGGFNIKKYKNVLIDNYRPPELSTDEAQLEPLLKYYADLYKPGIVCLLQPTSPLRTLEDIRKAYLLMNTSSNYDSIVSVTSVGDKYWLKQKNEELKPLYDPLNRLNRQDLKTDTLFYENGAIYFTKNPNCRVGNKVGFYVMPQRRSFQVDSDYDWRVCEVLLNG